MKKVDLGYGLKFKIEEKDSKFYIFHWDKPNRKTKGVWTMFPDDFSSIASAKRGIFYWAGLDADMVA